MDPIQTSNHIKDILSQNATADVKQVRELLAKARELKGLTLQDVAALLSVDDETLLEEMFHTAREIKETIYGNRIVLFAPLYISSECANNCLYCAFRRSNKEIVRTTLNQKQIADEIEVILKMGHKRVLLVAGEHPVRCSIEYMEESIKTVYETKVGKGEIRRLNVNCAPLEVEDFRRLKAANIGTYQCFQETYDPEVYKVMHPSGPKSDYLYRRTVMERAMEAGIDDVGIGPLLGLTDYRFEVLSTLAHSQELDEKFGVGPHTISIPRIEPATGVEISENPPHVVSDLDFKKLVAILRMAVPYTGMILSTRESPAFRDEVIKLGISQISAASRVDVGGYVMGDRKDGQFSVGDHRSMDEIMQELLSDGYVPSFCTGCYRLGRTGHDFMDLAKPGMIKIFCHPNALLTLKEYLEDYATPETKAIGEKVIAAELNSIPSEERRKVTLERLKEIESGKRDLYF
ncbi:MAG: [FeFe] hydrogenase H-cluster radical SAM maturase HydG [Phycisphaerae bacterium]|jgi:2-iminoacetate synthase|nr:[FeFe] hydrogenase H-cluster radical SAM maturase HydG [Phycisphaerae bacterium]